MTTTKQRKPLFERLQRGLAEGIAWSKGKVSLRKIEVVHKFSGERPPVKKPRQ